MILKNKISVLIILLLLIFPSKALSQANSDIIFSETYTYVHTMVNDQLVGEKDLNMSINVNVTEGTGIINYQFENDSFHNEFNIFSYTLYKSYIHFIVIDEKFNEADLIYIKSLGIVIQFIDEAVFIFTNNKSNLSLKSPVGKEEKVETYYY